MKHHNEDRITSDIKLDQVFLCSDIEQNIVGTITIKDNVICRLFVLPEFQGKGYGKEMLEYAENVILNEYSEIRLDASLPAKGMHQKRGYKDAVFHMIQVNYNDFLCYDVMIRQI